MNLLWFLSFLSFYFISQVVSDTTESLDKGWGNEIKWMGLQQAKTEATKSNKPIMVLITKSWCGACKALKPKFAESKNIAALSKHFLMVHLEDEEEPKGEEFQVDGRYIPRVFFLGADGKIMKDIINTNGKHVKEFKYYYGKVSQIVSSMKTALNKLNILFEDGLSRGFGDNINWVAYKDGLQQAEESKKSLLLLIHKSWCGACKEKYWNEGTEYPHTKYYYSKADELTKAMERVLKGTEEETKKAEKKKEETKEETKEEKKPWWTPKGGLQDDLSNGFGNLIQWRTYKDGLEQAKKSNKPMVVIFSKTTCPSCKALKGRFSTDKKLAEWSKKFVMVNVKENEGPEGKEFTPDGDYVPRILFLDPSGKVMSGFWNEGTNYKHVKYYYQDGDELIDSMKRVIKKFKKPAKDYAFKKKFAASENLIRMGRKLVMVNIEDDDAKLEKQFDVDGAYVPRIYFIDPYTKMVMKDVYNKDPVYAEFKFAYAEPKELLTSMRSAVKIGVSKPVPQGFGTEITWVPLNDALSQAKNSEKPVMMILHRSWCQHSQALKSKIAESQEIAKLSKDFVMVNLEDDEIPEKKYDIDGSYVPRIIFLDNKGEVQKNVTNPNTPVEDAAYFYENATDIISSMRKVSPVHGLDRGFGKDIAWMTFTEGLQHAKQNKKPAMVIIHKTWCGACKALKPHIAKSTEIHKLSKNFAMINVEDDEEPKDAKFNVDGLYFPRVFFLEPSGEVIKSIHNTKLRYIKYKYAYGDEETAYLPKFASSNDIKALSKKFVMVNVQDEFDHTDKRFDIDGAYIPRTFILNPMGEVMKDIHNEDTPYPENKYYYFDAESVVKSMEKALDEVKKMKKIETRDEL
ncbi:Thioredoxin domain-containing protein 12 [Exaiptasia diaphana]|nr:Thioredoxin domain-containing protein 12 [Exaiptasia diaphana]